MKSRKNKSFQHSDHTHEIPRLRKIIGQLEGTEKMIRGERYCVDILQQVRAAHSAVKALEIAILKRHINSCLTESAKRESATGFQKRTAELLDLIKS